MFSLPGNHDYFSGGDGFMWALKQLNQQASYICLENDNWCFIGIDTAYQYFKLKDQENTLITTDKMPVLND